MVIYILPDLSRCFDPAQSIGGMSRVV
jgi:hypothetical protein